MCGKLLPILVALLLAAAAGAARAYTPSAESYARLSFDKKSILVLTTGDPRQEPVGGKFFRLPGGRSVDLPTTFRKSGVYDVATFAPLWLMDFYAIEENLKATPDLEGVAVVDAKSFGRGGSGGLSFYHRGVVTRRYQCGELLRFMRDQRFFRWTSANHHLDWYSDFTRDGDTLLFETAPRRLGFKEFSMSTGLANSYVFDIRTGKILERKTTGVIPLALIAALVAGILFGPLFLRMVKKRGAQTLGKSD